jgi:drug/metabolite transporter (DMT)-like permease
MSLVVYIFVVYGMAAVSLLALALGAHFLTPTGLDTPLRSNPFWGYPPITYLWFALLALVPQLLGHSTFNWALGYLSAAYVSITLLGEPIGSTILAYFLLGEKPTTVKIIGAILILFGIYTASRRESTRREA